MRLVAAKLEPFRLGVLSAAPRGVICAPRVGPELAAGCTPEWHEKRHVQNIVNTGPRATSGLSSAPSNRQVAPETFTDITWDEEVDYAIE